MKKASGSRHGPRATATIATLVLAVLLIPVGSSYTAALAAPGSMGTGGRTVEWLRNNRMGFALALAEDVWYTINQPPEDGPTLRALPGRVKAPPTRSGDAQASNQSATRLTPTNVRPVIQPALQGEGVWTPAGQTVDGRSPILTTVLRPDSAHPSVVAGLAWIDTSHTHLALIPGLEEPESKYAPGPGYVPLRDRGSLLATFNSGFMTEDGGGGFIANGRVYVQPKIGLGTIAVYRDGHVKVGEWGTEIRPSSGIIYLRQNLPLLVDRGKINPMVNDRWPWVRNTVGNNVLVWRSGVGVDADGNLIYADGAGITESGLAGLLRHAGAVRAMALDENTCWTDFFAYGGPGGAQPSKLLPSMRNPMDRYLVPDQRDFFMVTK